MEDERYIPLKKIKMGSTIFFEKYPDYKEKDVDWFAIYNKVPDKKLMIRMALQKDDIFIYPKEVTKEILISEALSSDNALKVGKFLVPELVEYFGITIDDLKLFEDKFNKTDDKHKYQKSIYESYVKNNKFELTEEQRDQAYLEYKKYRPVYNE